MAVEIHLQAYDYDAGEFKDVAIDPATNAIKVKDITEAPTDHGELSGLADDDHTQYYNAARHTKEIHDALAIDHGSLFGRGDDDHTQYYNVTRHTKAIHDSLGLDHGSLSGKDDDDHAQYLNTTRHDTTDRHPVSVIKTSHGSATGTVTTTKIKISLNVKSFFPNLSGAGAYYWRATEPQVSGYSGEFTIYRDAGETTYGIYWDYLSASGPHQIWVIVNSQGQIQDCWEAPDPADPDNPNRPPIAMVDDDGNDAMPQDWQRLKISEPSDFREINEVAKEKKKSISGHIFDDYEVDIKNKKLKKRKKDE